MCRKALPHAVAEYGQRAEKAKPIRSLIPVLVTGIQRAVSTAQEDLLMPRLLATRRLAVRTHGGWIPVTSTGMREVDTKSFPLFLACPSRPTITLFRRGYTRRRSGEAEPVPGEGRRRKVFHPGFERMADPRRQVG